MNHRILKLHMKKGSAILVETKDLPLKDYHLLQTHELIFYCNTATMGHVAQLQHKGLADAEQANKLLEQFFIRDAQAMNIIPMCKQFGVNQKLEIVKN